MATILTGGCQCGRVRYALSAMPEGVHVCHCRMCQKAVGGPFAALTPVRLADFAWTRGTPARFESSSLAYRHFCADCGTPLSFGYHHRDLIEVSVGSLDTPGRVRPVRVFGTESRLAGYDSAALGQLPSRETSVTIDGKAVPVTSHQHPDHETAESWQPFPSGR